MIDINRLLGEYDRLTRGRLLDVFLWTNRTVDETQWSTNQTLILHMDTLIGSRFVKTGFDRSD